jgi:uncharacterized membrane protein
MRANLSTETEIIYIVPGGQQTIQLINPGRYFIDGIQASTTYSPDPWLTSLSVIVPSFLIGETSKPIIVEVVASATVSILVNVTLTSNQAATTSFSFYVTGMSSIYVTANLIVKENISRIVVNSALTRDVITDSNSIYELDVCNEGNLESGYLQVNIPQVQWFTLMSANPIPSLQPSECTTLSILISIPATNKRADEVLVFYSSI